MEEKIKALLDIGMSDEQIKEALEVSDNDIHKVLNSGKESIEKSELSEPVVQERLEMPYTGRRADTHRPTKVTEEVFDNIKERFMNGETSRQLADDTKLGRGTINRIVQANNIDEYFSKRKAERAKYSKPKKTELSPELIELRTMNDYLARIVEAVENKPKKRGWFRK